MNLRPPSPRATLLLILALVALIYLPVVHAGWVWDDRGLVLHNTAITQPTWATVFARDLWCCTNGDPTAWFRPLMTVSLLVDHHLFGVSTVAAHLHSLFWHLVCVTGVYGLVAHRLGHRPAVIGALWFGLHPLQSEAVVWVAARNDLLATAGVVGALAGLGRRRPGLVFTCTTFALLAKESAVLLLPMAAVWEWGGGRRIARSDSAAILVAVGLWALLRSNAMLGAAEVLPASAELYAQAARVALLGWSWWTVPWPLTATADLTLPRLTAAALVGVATSTGLLGLTLWRGGRAAVAGWCLVVLGLLPALAGLVVYGTLGERYFYLPMLGVAYAVAAAVAPRVATEAGSDGVRIPRAARVGAALLCGVSAVLLAVRLPDWHSDTTLFEAAWARAPDSYSAYHLGMARVEDGRHAEGLALLEESLTLPSAGTHACRYVADTARKVLGPDEFLAHAPLWTRAGCRDLVGFDGPVATQLIAWGRWADARSWLAANTQPDPSGRLVVARAALCAHDGDLLGQAAAESTWSESPARLRDRVATLLSARP